MGGRGDGGRDGEAGEAEGGRDGGREGRGGRVRLRDILRGASSTRVITVGSSFAITALLPRLSSCYRIARNILPRWLLYYHIITIPVVP